MSTVALEDSRVIPKTSPRRRPNRRVLMVTGGAVALGIIGVVWMRMPPSSVATDNAYLKADSTLVSTRVRGLVAEVLVADNAQVRPGQPLLRVDSPEYVARLAAAQGELAKAEAQVAAARAALARGYAEGDLARSVVRQVATDITVAEAQSVRARADLSRYDALASDGTVARREVEKVRAEAIGAEAAVERSRAALAVSRAQAVAADRRRGELAAAVAAAEAERARAQSALDLARRDEADTLVRAPVAGVVGDRKVNPGDYIEPGARLLTVVPSRGLYVTANFKETQTPRLLVGQPATVKVDALPGVLLRARVQSVSPASGAEFALLPFEPGTGNFTKIVQRVPVRLTLEAGQPEVARLRPGLSVRVKVALADDAAASAN
jgi:membrane fusion protein, multidrug efflux system